MRKVILRMNEQERYEIIKKLIENKGNKYIASTKLNCSLRTIQRLIKKYKLKGKNGFIHGNRNSTPSTTINEEIKKEIITLYNSPEYQFANFNGIIALMDNTYFLNKHLINSILNIDGSLRLLYLKQNSFR